MVKLFNQHLGRFSAQFQDLYIDFTSRRTQLPLSALTQLTFWNVVRDIALLQKNQFDSKPQSLKVRLELEDEDSCFWLSLTCDREVQQGTLKAFPLPVSRETGYRFILVTVDGAAPYDDKFSFNKPNNNSDLDHAIERVEAVIGQGILLFQETDENVSVLTEDLPMAGPLRALVSSKLNSDLSLALIGKQSRHSVRKSTHPGWFEWRGLTAELLRHKDVRLYPSLAAIGCLRPVLMPADIAIRGGIRTGNSFITLLSSLPSFQIEDADRVDWIRSGKPTIAMQIANPDGIWRFGDDIEVAELVGSHRVRAFYKDVMIAERFVSFVEASFTTDYKSPQNEDRWLIEESSIDLQPLSKVGSEDLVASQSALINPIENRAILHVEQLDTHHSETLEELVLMLACRFEAQRGLAEITLVRAFESTLKISGAELWAVLRAWTEAGFLDVVSDARWRARVYFAHVPRLVYVTRGDKKFGVLTGLIPRFLLKRFRHVCSSLGLKASSRVSFSSYVPSVYECELETIDQLIELSRQLEVGQARKSTFPIRYGPPIRTLAEGHSSPTHDSWPTFRSWDWKRRMFPANVEFPELGGISLKWCRRDDGPDRYKVYRDEEQLWWTRSRTWAVLAAFALAGEMPFERRESSAVEAWGDSIYLPLPIARAVALTAKTVPGPVKLAGKISYRSEFASVEQRELLFESLWPESRPDSPSKQRWFDVAVIRVLSRRGASSMPIPTELRHSLRSLSGTSLISPSTSIPALALPELYALRRVLRERNDRCL